MPNSRDTVEPVPHKKHLQRVPFVAVTAFFIGGIIFADYASLHIFLPLAVLLSAVAAAVLFSAIQNRTLATVAVLVAFCAAGAADFSYRCTYRPPGHVGNIVTSERFLARIRGTVCTDPLSRQKAPLLLTDATYDDWGWETAFDLDVSGIDSGSEFQPLIGRITVKIYEENPGVHYGDEIILTGQLQAPNIRRNPAQFNYKEYLRRKGIHAILYVSSGAGVEWTGRRTGWIRRSLFDIRDRLVSFITQSDQPGNQLLAAMLLGAREELSPDDEDNFQKSGITHILAISGLHVGMIAVMLYFVTALLRLPEKLKVAAILAGLVFYVLLTGGRPPAVRAAVLCAVVLFGGILNRRQISLNSLALAALIILMVAPGEVFMRGFQLSFLAVLSIIYFYNPIRKSFDRLKHPLEGLQDPDEMAWWLRLFIFFRRNVGPVVAMALAASIGVTPIVAATFHIVSVFGVLANALFVPLASVAVWLGMIGLCVALPASLVWSHADVLLYPATSVASALQWIAGYGASVPFSHFYTAGPSVQFLVAYYLILILIVARHHLKLTPKRLSFGVLIFLNIFAAGALLPARQDSLLVTCSDVRHGGCTFFELPDGKTLLYDCGTSSHFFDVGSYTLAPLLWQKGISSIDLIILSHPDADHVNGVISLTDYFRIGCVAYGPHFDEEPLGKRLLAELEKKKIECRELCAGDSLPLGQAKAHVLNPPRESPFPVGTGPNNYSLVVKLSVSGRKFLLTGDIEEQATALMQLSRQDLEADVVFLPHHGSTYSNLNRLLQTAAPQLTIASCSADEVTEELRSVVKHSGASLYTTAECGAIEVRNTKDGLRIVPFTGSE